MTRTSDRDPRLDELVEAIVVKLPPLSEEAKEELGRILGNAAGRPSIPPAALQPRDAARYIGLRSRR